MISGQYIKKLAENAGFDLCGITPCKHLAENESYFREWLAKGYGSSLEYLERNLDKRSTSDTWSKGRRRSWSAP